MPEFSLHPQLEKDSVLVTELSLCSVLLINDATYPWLILVPRVPNIVEIIDLPDAQQQQLWQESALISQVLKHLFTPDKLNVAALGNMVPQLHLHHIVRYVHDVSWPNPVWGRVPAQAYCGSALTQRLNLIQSAITTRSEQ
jgi:diadenosine tetraphosphate (Ap4A) HIT family hydrolase